MSTGAGGADVDRSGAWLGSVDRAANSPAIVTPMRKRPAKRAVEIVKSG